MFGVRQVVGAIQLVDAPGVQGSGFMVHVLWQMVDGRAKGRGAHHWMKRAGRPIYGSTAAPSAPISESGQVALRAGADPDRGVGVDRRCKQRGRAPKGIRGKPRRRPAPNGRRGENLRTRLIEPWLHREAGGTETTKRRQVGDSSLPTTQSGRDGARPSRKRRRPAVIDRRYRTLGIIQARSGGCNWRWRDGRCSCCSRRCWTRRRNRTRTEGGRPRWS